METSGEPAALQLEPWRHELAADGTDATPVTVSAVDEKGRFVPVAMNKVLFHIDGGARLLSVGNGDPTCHEPDKANSRSLFNGLCQAIVQSGFDPGEAVLTSSADDMNSWLHTEAGTGEDPALAAAPGY